MNEQLINAWRWIKRHLDRVVVGTIVALFLIQVALYMKERSLTPPPPPQLTPLQLREEIDPKHLKLVEDVYGPGKKSKTSELVDGLIKFNMFDVKAVKSRQDIEREISSKIQDAQRLYNQGKKQEALKVLDEILQLDRNYLRAIDLKSKIESEIQPAPAQ